MKKLLSLAALLCSIVCVNAQEGVFLKTPPAELMPGGRNLYSGTLILRIYSPDADEARSRLEDFIRRQNFNSLSFSEYYRNSFNFTFEAPASAFPLADSVLAGLGEVMHRSFDPNTKAEANALLMKEYYRKTIAEYRELLKTVEPNSAEYRSWWQSLRESEARAHTIDEQLLLAEAQRGRILVQVSISEEREERGDSRFLSSFFVNMPGIEYGLLKIENPTPGISAPLYRGFSLKYLFTRGKSYITLGAYKAASERPADDSARFDELFVLNFSQDFYPRLFGRGNNTFLNLYTGYSIGGIFASNVHTNETMFGGGVHLGLELFRTEHILFDNRLSYFLPFRLNRSLRGLQYTVSLNFAF